MKKINVMFILDKSGSMDCVKDATISGFNEYVDSLKKDKKNEYSLALTLFDTVVEKKKAQDISKVKKLTDKTYVPDGLTALYDAICKTIMDAKEQKGKNLVVIMTDGGENASAEYTERNLQKLVKELDKKKNWTFVFLGANQDSWGTASNFGFSKGNVANYNSTREGTFKTMSVLASNTVSYSASTGPSTSTFFSANDKENLKNTK